MKEQLEEIIIAFFENELSAEQENDLMEKRKNAIEVEQLFQEYALLYQDVENQKIELPTAGLQSNFEKLLEKEKQNLQEVNEASLPKKPRGRILFFYASIAAVFLFFAIGLGIFISNNSAMREMNNEIVLLRSEMKKLMTHSSTSVRIQAVNLSFDLEKPDEDVVQVLVKTMKSDPSENVKLAAVNALGKFAQHEDVKQELIKALENQENTYVQIKIINILSNIKAKDAIPSFDELIKNEKTEFLVKAEAKLGKSRIIEM